MTEQSDTQQPTLEAPTPQRACTCAAPPAAAEPDGPGIVVALALMVLGALSNSVFWVTGLLVFR